jgi:chromosomal replication initiation ATPase DnaA
MDKPIKSFKQHIDSTKLSLPKVANQTDINKYRNHPLIKTLNITDIEFKKFGSLIKRIVDEETQCLANPDRCFSNKNQHLRLIRGQNGKLHPIIVPCEKTLQLAIIREKYLIRSFPDSFLNVHLSPTFFKKNDPSKIAILNIYKSYVNHKQIEHGIYVYGDMGIGKTYTSIALANEMASLGFSIAFIFVPDIVYELKQGFGQERNNNQQIMDKMKFADILFLDDFGAENNST